MNAGTAIVDWLRFSFLPQLSETESVQLMFRYLNMFMSLPIAGEPSTRGIHGYSKSWDIKAFVDGDWVRLGIIASGGSNVGGTMLFDLSGQGCSLVNDWPAVYSMMQEVEARITRCDLAVDFLEGEYSYEHVKDLYYQGEFNSGGRIPKYTEHNSGTYHAESCNGRTFEIGRRVNGKMVRCYEKGKQLGNPDSPWVRIEIELRNRDRIIPHEVVLKPTEFFAGSHKALAAFVEAAAQRIATIQKQSDMSLDKSLKWIKESAGKHIDQLIKHRFPEIAEFVAAVRVSGIPTKLTISALAPHVQGQHDPGPILTGELKWK